MGVHFPAGLNLGGTDGIRIGVVPVSGPPDPLAGIPLALRLQTHAGFGATPNATTGLYKVIAQSATLTSVFPSLDLSNEQTAEVIIDGSSSVVIYSFAATDPGDGSIYLGPATGVPAVDCSTFVAAVSSHQSGFCTCTTDGAGNYTLTSLTAGTDSFVEVTGPSIIAGPSSGADAIPATLDGDAIAAWADVLGTSGLIGTQSNTMFQPVLRFNGSSPMIVGDGVDDELDGVLSLGQTQSVFMLCKKNSPVSSSAQTAFALEKEGNGGVFSYSSFAASGLSYFPAMGGVPLGGNVENWNVVSLIYNSSSSLDIYLNGSHVGNFTPANNDYFSAPDYFLLNCIGAVAGDFSLMAFLRMSSAADNSTRTTIESYLETLP